MNQHTPGPWRISHWQRTLYVSSGEDAVVRTAGFEETKNAEANARLIAAAPELYDQLIKGSIRATDGPCWCDPETSITAPHSIYCENTRAVIAKAEGK